MLLEPCRQGLRRAVRQEVDGTVLLQVYQDGAVGLSFPARPIIDPRIRGGAQAGSGIARTSRSTVSALVGMPRMCSRRAPASPPQVTPIRP